MKLSEDLKYWRAERPDEWTMDDFVRKAEELEEALIVANGTIAKLEKMDKEGV